METKPVNAEGGLNDTGLVSVPGGWTWSNWAGIHGCKPKYFHQPSSIEEMRRILRHAREHDMKVKVAGAGHSPSDIACTEDHLVNLDRFNRIIRVDTVSMTATVEGGIRISEMNEKLSRYGMALSNLGSISDQSIAGALSTGTHGTGIRYGILATHVVDLELLLASGELIRASREENPRLFSAALCGIGCLGIIVSVTIECEKSYDLLTEEFSVPFDKLLDEYPTKYLEQSDHFRFHWFPHTDKCRVWQASRTTKARTKQPSLFHRLVEKYVGYHLLQFVLWWARLLPSIIPWVNALWYFLLYRKRTQRIDTSYKSFNFDCLFRQYVNEWSIPVEHTTEALVRLRQLIHKRGFKAHFPVEVRFVKRDDIMLSPSYGRDSAFIGIIMYKPYGFSVEFRDYFMEFQKLMLEYGGRPHWAKEFSLNSQDFDKLYPEWGEFVRLKDRLDPSRIFENGFTRRIFGPHSEVEALPPGSVQRST